MTTAQIISPLYNAPSEMEITGFVVFSASSDGNDINPEVKRSLTSNPRTKNGHFIYGRGDATICGRFLRCGAEEDNAFDRKIKEAIGKPDFPVHQGPIIVVSENQSTWGTRFAHPSHDAVSVFRDISETDQTRVIFKLYSPGLPKEATMTAEPFVRKLRRNEILFVKGSVRMKIEVPTEGSFVWYGKSATPMGRDMFNPDAFEFMVL